MRRASIFLAVIFGLSSACTGAINESANGSSPGGAGQAGASDDGSSTGGSTSAGGTTGAACDAAGDTAPNKWRRLTKRQYRNTIKDLLGVDASTEDFLSDSKTGVFATNTLPPQANDIGAYHAAAQTIARRAVADPAKLMNCNPASGGEATCLAKFLKEFGARAYRRELTSAEVAGLTDTYNLGKVDGVSAGLQMVLEVVLQSPNFLYLTEFGVGAGTKTAKLSPDELATRLSYLLWNSMPDATLAAAAKTGDLNGDSIESVQAQAKRMMKDPRFAATLADFHTQLFHLDRLSEADLVQKSNAPEFDASMRKAMLNDVSAFVRYAVEQNQGSVKTLFTAPWAFPAGPLLGIYKVTQGQLADGRYSVTDGSRAGLLTSPAFMASEPPTPTPYGIVQRGKMVRTMLLCDTLPPPPPDLKFLTPPDAETIPQRELLEQHKSDPSCKGCHTLMDPIGLGFENFDSMGRYRLKYPKGEQIDPSGEILGDTDVDGRFKNFSELAAKLGSSQQVRACLGKHWFRYAYGRDPVDQDACVLESFAEALGKGDGDLPTSLLSFVATDAFRFRKGITK